MNVMDSHLVLLTPKKSLVAMVTKAMKKLTLPTQNKAGGVVFPILSKIKGKCAILDLEFKSS